jgi:hypothetical protein
VVLLAIITEGLAVALMVAVFGVMIQTKKLILHQLAFNFGMIAVTVTAAWFMHRSLATTNIAGPVSTEAMAILLASFVYFLGNSLSVAMIVALSKKESMVEVWLNGFMHSAPSYLLAGLSSLGLVALISSQSLPVVLALVAVTNVVYYTSIRHASAPVIRELGLAK